MTHKTITITIYDNTLHINSPGSILTHLDPEHLHECGTHYRNPMLAGWAATMTQPVFGRKFFAERGTGVAHAKREIEAAGGSLQFEFDEYRCLTTVITAAPFPAMVE